MIRLVLFDLRDHAATWIGAFAVAVTCGLIGGWAVSIETTAQTYDGLRNVGPGVLVFSMVAAVAVLASAANLTVAAQRRSYALWQLANVKPRTVSRIVLAQLAIVALAGAVCGTLVAAVTFGPLCMGLFSGSGGTVPFEPQVGVSLMPSIWIAVAGVFLLGGFKGARRAGKTPPLAVLREAEPKRTGMTAMRVLLFFCLALCTGWVFAIMIGLEPDVIFGTWSLYVPILVTATLVPIAPLVFSGLLRVWTLLVPQRFSSAWYLARHTACYGLEVSTSVQTPIMVGFGLVAGLFSSINVWADYAARQSMDFTGMNLAGSLVIMGGPVLLCAVGAAVSVVMSSRSRTRDVALLVASGAKPKTLVAAAACEAFIHAATATLAGMACVLVSNAALAFSAGMPLFDDVLFGEGLLVSLMGFLLVLTATLVPTLTALNRETAEVLAIQE